LKGKEREGPGEHQGKIKVIINHSSQKNFNTFRLIGTRGKGVGKVKDQETNKLEKGDRKERHGRLPRGLKGEKRGGGSGY